MSLFIHIPFLPLNSRDCLEKRDLVERLIDTRGSAPPSSFSGYSDGGSAGGLSQEENRVVDTFTRSSPSVAYIQTTSQQQTIQRDFSLKGTEIPIGTGSGFLWDDKVSCNSFGGHYKTCFNSSVYMLKCCLWIPLLLRNNPLLPAEI